MYVIFSSRLFSICCCVIVELNFPSRLFSSEHFVGKQESFFFSRRFLPFARSYDNDLSRYLKTFGHLNRKVVSFVLPTFSCALAGIHTELSLHRFFSVFEPEGTILVLKTFLHASVHYREQ